MAPFSPRWCMYGHADLMKGAVLTFLLGSVHMGPPGQLSPAFTTARSGCREVQSGEHPGFPCKVLNNLTSNNTHSFTVILPQSPYTREGEMWDRTLAEKSSGMDLSSSLLSTPEASFPSMGLRVFNPTRELLSGLSIEIKKAPQS